MSAYQDVFQRYETKYILSGAQHAALKDFLMNEMQEDSFGKYTVGNVYYDTPDYSIVRHSMEKPVYKEKLRLRCYGEPDDSSEVFAELKKKYKGIVYKRRVVMSLDDARLYLNDGIRPKNGGQIHREIDWFMGCYRPEPKMYVAYDRTALSGVRDPELRLTLDSNIRYRTTDVDLAAGARAKPRCECLWDDGRVLLEIKFRGAMPLWLVEKLSELGIFKTSFSKYGSCYECELLKTARIRRSGLYERYGRVNTEVPLAYGNLKNA
jgi:hypothetical protein